LFGYIVDVRLPKWLPIFYKFNLESVALEVERRIEVKGVLRVPAAVVAKRGATAYIMKNNGPHFIVKTISPEEKRKSQYSLMINRTQKLD